MRRYRSLVIAMLATLGLLAAAGTASAGTGIVRGVVNADGGVFWRGNPPDWNSPIRNVGYGVYNGDQIELECWTNGSTVPPYNNNTLWYDAVVVAGLGKGEGFVNDHFIDTGINQPNIVVPGVPQCDGGSSAPAPPPPATGDSSVYSIFNADGGIYFRNSPRWSDTWQTPGIGVYNGDQVRLICGAFGEAVGPYANTWWSRVQNLSRPGAGEGWVNGHFINDGMPANSPSPGEATCDGTTGAGNSGNGTSVALHGGGALYYSPYDGNIIAYKKGTKYSPSPSQRTVHRNVWNKGNGCFPTVPNFDGEDAGRQITTLAAWSASRNVPFALLQTNPTWIQQINYIVLFDPGNADQYKNARCTTSAKASKQLTQWLAKSAAHHLTVFAGQVAATDNFAGIQRGLFDAVRAFNNPRGRNIREQIVVCPYPHMIHEDIWDKFRNKMNDPPVTRTNCPTVDGVPRPKGWNP